MHFNIRPNNIVYYILPDILRERKKRKKENLISHQPSKLHVPHKKPRMEKINFKALNLNV